MASWSPLTKEVFVFEFAPEIWKWTGVCALPPFCIMVVLTLSTSQWTFNKTLHLHQHCQCSLLPKSTWLPARESSCRTERSREHRYPQEEGGGSLTSNSRVIGSGKHQLPALLMFWVALNKPRLFQWVAGQCLFHEICEVVWTFTVLQSLNTHRWWDQYLLRYHKPPRSMMWLYGALNLSDEHTSLFSSSRDEF